MRSFLPFVFLLFFASAASAQTISIRGVVRNEDGKPLSNASVTLFYEGAKDSVRRVTNDKGVFQFTNVKQANTGIIVSFIGYNTLARYYDYSTATGEQNIVDLQLTPGGQTLANVVVEAAKVQIKEDTVSYKIDSTMYRKNDNVEEVLKKLPGVEVDNKTGKVTAQGQEVTKVKVNGKDFFGGDVTTATRNLNADMVDKIDIIDDYGDQAAFTGVKSGEATKTLNIQMKKDKNKGYFGNASLGAGTEGRYTNSINVNKFNGQQQISLLGNLNNTNASTFNFGSMGGAMGGMARSMGANFSGNTGNGIATTKSIGLNYRDQWGSKISVYGSYSFTNKETSTERDVTQQTLFQGSNILNKQQTNDYTTTDNHRFTFNMEYKIDSFNYLKFTPTVNYTTTNSNYISDFSNAQNNKLSNNGRTTDRTTSKAPNISGTILFNHRFDKKGRILSLNLSGGSSSSDGEDIYTSLTGFYDTLGVKYKDSVLNQFVTQDNNNHNYGISASYIEPLNKKQSLEFNYSYNKRYTGIDRENFAVDPLNGNKTFVDTASNIYDNDYITNRIGVNFRTTQKKYNYTIGFAVQPATIKSDSKSTNTKYSQNLVNYYPVIRFAYNFSRSRSFSVNYNGSTSQPSYQQLQPVYDYSNPQYITLGNPDLKPEFNNNVNIRYNNFDFITGNVFFGNLNFSYIKDKIVNNVFQRFDVSDPTNPKYIGQETRYLNTDGYYTASGFYAFSKPIRNRKYVFNYGGSIMYNNNISFVESAKNTGQNWIVGQRFSTTITIKKWLETSAGANFTLNNAKYSLNKRLNSNTKAWSLTHYSRIFLPKDITIAYDLDKSINDGYADNVTANPFIINSSIEKLISKKYNASIKLNAYDMLNENTSVTRTVTGTGFTDTRTNRLGRYYMLSFVFRFNKFTGTGSGGNNAVPGGPMMRTMIN
ncbi:outer membrane beta-barrel protein [Ferruginibacter sp. HRS2-29]|uniref:outer membrane beta-barrel protein n=1 Tax=Ferruginibacter sp. HRS2-29 TaxID=2487334 RepID=UPI0020CF6C99|nr:outer membrane beta-barrel protein [Ferruginibacter sp. HRS2-29]MCP9752056.1 hypothetical protein [Ferruginibacter sp. HRS2-29]